MQDEYTQQGVKWSLLSLQSCFPTIFFTNLCSKQLPLLIYINVIQSNFRVTATQCFGFGVLTKDKYQYISIPPPLDAV